MNPRKKLAQIAAGVAHDYLIDEERLNGLRTLAWVRAMARESLKIHMTEYAGMADGATKRIQKEDIDRLTAFIA